MADKKKEETLERIYTVPLRPAFINAPPHRKSLKAAKALREFLAKHMKSKDVRIGAHVNELIWQHGIKNPPPRVTVKATKGADGVVRADLEGKAYKESVKATPKEEKETLKEKLASKLGPKADKADAAEEKSDAAAEPKPAKPKAPKAERKE